jgi:GMP synthase (glutamine-hydrolysing)
LSGVARTTLAVFQHEAATGLGRLGDLLRGLGVAYDLVWTTDAYLPDPQDYDGVLALGGSLGANDSRLQPARRWIREAVGSEIPYLGICLGGQLLASALGAHVGRGGAEVGMHSIFVTDAGGHDHLFRGLPRRVDVFGFHGDSFALPRGAVPLAGSLASTYQAFRYGASAYGLQFHPEVRAVDLGRWRHVRGYRQLLGESGREWSDLTAELGAAAGTLDELAAHLLERWVSVIADVSEARSHPTVAA